MVLDFTEIPPANGSDGRQDEFEFFARDFLLYRGYRVVEGPDRGPDRGRDLIVEKDTIVRRKKRTLRFLVSCKHKAHSGNNVSERDEPIVRDKVDNHHCDGFIAFYSAGVTSGLGVTLDTAAQKMPVERYDPARIERELLEARAGEELALRYFPLSMTDHILRHPLYHTTAMQELARRSGEFDPDYSVDVATVRGIPLISLNPKRPGLPPATIANITFQFHKDRDRRIARDFQKLFTEGQPVLIPKENIAEALFHNALIEAIPSLNEIDVLHLIPLGSTEEYRFDLVIEDADGTEAIRYPQVILNRVKGGTEKYTLSNERHESALRVEIATIKEGRRKGHSLSLTASYPGFSVSAALKAYRFMLAMKLGAVVRFVHPDTSIGDLMFNIRESVSQSWVMETLEYLEVIQRHINKVLYLPDRQLTGEDRSVIEFVGQLLPTGVSPDLPELALAIELNAERSADLLSDRDLADSDFALIRVQEDMHVTVLDQEVLLGTILTHGAPVRFTRDSIAEANAAIARNKEVSVIRAEPSRAGSIKRYQIERISDDDLEALRSTMPSDSMARIAAIRRGKGKKNVRIEVGKSDSH